MRPLTPSKTQHFLEKQQLPGSTFDLPLPATSVEVQAALILFQAGQIAQALELAQDLARRSPDMVALLDLQGAALRKLGMSSKSLGYFKRSLEVGGPSPTAYFNIGAVLFDMAQFGEAAPYLRQAAALAPENLAITQVLALCLNAMGHFHDTVTLLTQQVSSAKMTEALLNILGQALQQINHLEEAEACYRSVQGTAQEVAEAQSHLGSLAKAKGQFETAQVHYLKAVNLAPHLTTAHRNLSALIHYERDHPHLQAMQLLIKQPGLTAAHRAELHFALFKAHQDLKELETAFAHLQAGNQLKCEKIGYSIDADEALFAHLRRIFNQPAPEAKSDLPFRPIFIVGLPRSGTTLTEQILCSCDGVTGAGELQYTTSAMVPLLQELQDNNQDSLTLEQVQGLRAELGAKMQHHSNGAPVLIDKMPLNLRWIGALLAAFPEARIVYTTRPRQDMCWSLYKVCFQGAGNGFAYDLNTAARYQAMADALMQHWQDLFPGRIHHLDHSLLTAAPEEHAKALVDFCGLSWSEACLHPERQAKPVFTASALQVRQPIYQRNSPDWGPYQAYLAPICDLFSDTAD